MERFNVYSNMFIKYNTKFNDVDAGGRLNLISAKKKQLILKLLSADDSDTDNTTVCDVLIATMTKILGSSRQVTEILRNLSKNVKDKRILKKVNDLLARAQDKQKKGGNKIYYQKQDISVSTEPSYEEQVLTLKYGNYAQYAINKALDKDYKPKKPKLISVGKFEDASRQQLVEMFSADKFYQLSSDQKIQLFQAVINDYCKSQGVESCGLKIDDLPVSKDKVCYGEYIPDQSTIVLNRTVFEGIDNVEGNKFLPLQILSTIVHEAQHRVQFETLDGPYNSERQEAVAKSIKDTHERCSYNDYLAELDELDARGCAQQYIKDMAEELDNADLRSFYNTKQRAEIQNSKTDIENSLKAHFPDIYYSAMLGNGRTMISEQQKFIQNFREAVQLTK